MANIITCVRIACSIPLLFFSVPSVWFYVFYIIGGLSDILDGIVARKTKTESMFGARLDSIADLIFVSVCFIKLLPMLNLPVWLWVWCGIIALIRIFNIICGYCYQKKLVMLHTIANKAVGVMLFILPLSMLFVEPKYPIIFIAVVATFASVQEGHFIRTGKEIT